MIRLPMKDFATPFFSEKKYIKHQKEILSDERLSFRDGERLGDIALREETPATCRKVRRIMEKRIAQSFWRNSSASKQKGARPRFEVRRNVSNHMRNIFGEFLPMRECA